MYSRQTSTVNIDRQCTVDKNQQFIQTENVQQTNINNQYKQTLYSRQKSTVHIDRQCTVDKNQQLIQTDNAVDKNQQLIQIDNAQQTKINS